MLKAIAAGKHTNKKTLHSIKYVPLATTNRAQKDIVSDVIKKKETYTADPDHSAGTKLKGSRNGRSGA